VGTPLLDVRELNVSFATAAKGLVQGGEDSVEQFADDSGPSLRSGLKQSPAQDEKAHSEGGCATRK